MLIVEVHLHSNYCHPIRRDNERVEKYPIKQIINSFKIKKKFKYLNTGVRTQIKIKFCGMCNPNVNCCSGRDIKCFSHLILFFNCKQTSMMTFLNGNKCDTRLITPFQKHTSLAHAPQFAL